MRHVLDIDYPVEKMEASRKRMEARGSFTYADRVPVGFCLVARYFHPPVRHPLPRLLRERRGSSSTGSFNSSSSASSTCPKTSSARGPVLSVGPYFDNVLDSAACGAEIVWPENETLHSRPHHPHRGGDGALPAAGARHRAVGAGPRLGGCGWVSWPAIRSSPWGGLEARLDVAPLGNQRPQPAHDRRGTWSAPTSTPGSSSARGSATPSSAPSRTRSSRRSTTSWRSTRDRAGGFGLGRRHRADSVAGAVQGVLRALRQPPLRGLQPRPRSGPGACTCAGRAPTCTTSSSRSCGISSFDLFGYMVEPRRGPRRTSAAASTCGGTSTPC